MRSRRALAIGILGALLLLAYPAAPALACSFDDDCDWTYSPPEPTGPAGAFGYDGPIGPDATYDGNVFTWFDGTTTDRYQRPAYERPSLLDLLIRDLQRLWDLLDGPNPGDPIYAPGSGIRG